MDTVRQETGRQRTDALEEIHKETESEHFMRFEPELGHEGSGNGGEDKHQRMGEKVAGIGEAQ